MTDPDESLAKFAAAFLANYAANDQPPLLAAASLSPYPGITVAAADLLRAVDAGGVPAFITETLKRIAAENGIAVDDAMTPNTVIEALRSISAATIEGS
jgi:hypothetical protein